MLARLGPEVADRFVRRLVRERYHVPEAVLLVLTWVTSLFCVFVLAFMVIVVLGNVAMIIADAGGIYAEALSVLFGGLAFVGVVVVPVVSAFFVTGMVYQRIRRGLLRDQIVCQGTTVRLRSCPACGYDQAGTPGASCPECGCAVAFPGLNLNR